MTDPIANLIAAAKRAVQVYNGDTTHLEERVAIDALDQAIAAAEARPEPKPDDACDFYEQLPKGPTHGRFSASDRAELGDLKRKAFEAARPEPAAEPKRDRMPPKFWLLLDELGQTGDRRAYEALMMLGTAIDSIEVRR